jgi:hypothetical protein
MRHLSRVIIHKLIYGAPVLEPEPIQRVGSTWPWGVIIGAILVVVPSFAIAYGLAGWFGIACVIGFFVILLGLGMIVVGLQEN